MLLAAMCVPAATAWAQNAPQRMVSPASKKQFSPAVLKVQSEAEFAARPKAILKQEDILIEEDFDAFTNGTDEQPDTLDRKSVV